MYYDKNGNRLPNQKWYSATDEQVQAAIDARIQDGSIDVGDLFYTVTDESVNMLTMPKGSLTQDNPEGFSTQTGVYTIVDYFEVTTSFISLIVNYNANTNFLLIAFYDSNKTFIAVKQAIASVGHVAAYTSETEDSKVYVISVPEGTAYARVQYRNDATTKTKYALKYMYSVTDYVSYEMKEDSKFSIRAMIGLPNLDTSYTNKTVLCLGDSITENNTHNNNKSWCMYLHDVFGMTVLNYGKSGTGLIKAYLTLRGICNTIDLGSNNFPSNINPDIILIMGNGNDATGTGQGTQTYRDYEDNAVTVVNEYGKNALPIGSPTDTTADITVHGAMKHLIEALVTKWPLAKIGFITSTPRATSLASLWGQDKANFYGHGAFHDYVEAIKYECEEYGVPCLDLYHNSIFKPWNTTNANTYYADGSTHPNTLGTVEGIVKPVARWMMEVFF